MDSLAEELLHLICSELDCRSFVHFFLASKRLYFLLSQQLQLWHSIFLNSCDGYSQFQSFNNSNNNRMSKRFSSFPTKNLENNIDWKKKVMEYYKLRRNWTTASATMMPLPG